MKQYVTGDDHFPLVFIYDNDDDGWQPIKTYRGIPPNIGDRITIERRWANKPGKREVDRCVVMSRHLCIEVTYGNTIVETQKFEIGVEKANVSRMTIERKEDG